MKKIGYIILAIVIIVGAIMTIISGFNVDLVYSNHKELRVSLGKEYNIDDVKTIANDVLGKEKSQVVKLEKFNSSFIIKSKEMSNEQVESLKQKISEKYNITDEDKENSFKVLDVPSFRLRDIIKPYIVSGIISTCVIILFMAIRYKKIGSIKVVCIQLLSIILGEGLIISIYAITKLPINRVFMPVILLVYILTFIICNIKFVSELNNMQEADEKK